MDFEQIYKKISASGKQSYKQFEKDFLKALLEEINQSVTTRGGDIVGTTKSSGRIVTDAIKKFYQSSAYKNSIMKILRDIQVIGDVKAGVYKDADMEISKSSITNPQKVVIDEFLDSVNDNGLNSRFNQTYRKLIYDNIRVGASQTALKAELQKLIISGKAPSAMARYVQNTAIQTADAYSAIIDREVFNSYANRVTHYRIVGSLIETSSPQCRYAVENFDREIPIDKLDVLFAIAEENGLIEGTNAENLPVNKLHWGCRHQFVPIIKIEKPKRKPVKK